jgi:hypothetical protein
VAFPRGARLNQKPVGDLAERVQRALGDGYKITEDLGGGMARVFERSTLHSAGTKLISG